MANRFIHTIKKPNGNHYAMVCLPRRENGKKINETEYLGKVISLNEQKTGGQFESRSRGIFSFTLAEGYSYPETTDADSFRASREKCHLSFGDVYCVHKFLKVNGFLELFRSIDDSSPDTLMALLMHRLLTDYPDSHAKDWTSYSIARMLYPLAKLESQRISEYLAKLGDEGLQQRFFASYLSKQYPSREGCGILIDSKGLPNNNKLNLTACNNHNGVKSKEIRLIYVVDKNSRLPIFYRYVPGNVVDVSTLKTTLDELAALNVNVENSVLDASYYSELNIREMYSFGISFMTRLPRHTLLYKNLVADYYDDIYKLQNVVVYNERIIYIIKKQIKLFGHTGYSYIGIEKSKMDAEASELIKELYSSKKDKMTIEEAEIKLKTMGMFVLISSEDMEPADVLPFYYSRQTIEQIFDVSKNYARLLPLGVKNTETFRGHLLLSFITTVTYLLLQKQFKASKFNTIDFIVNMHGLICKVFDKHLIVNEPTKKHKEIADVLKIKLPNNLEYVTGMW